MKKLIPFVVLMFFAVTPVVFAQKNSTPSSASTTPAEKLDDLKDRLATKVAQLRTLQKKAIFGTVKDIGVSSVTIETKTSDIKIELVDEINVFQYVKGKRTKLTTEDLDKGDIVSVFGDFDASLDLLKAKVIFIQQALPIRSSGVISKIDTDNYTVTITTPDEKEYVIDIEKYTIVRAYANDTLTKGGFSKLETGSTIQVVGSANAKTENRMSASRIIDLGKLTKEEPTSTPEPSNTKAPTPTHTETPTPTKKGT